MSHRQTFKGPRDDQSKKKGRLEKCLESDEIPDEKPTFDKSTSFLGNLKQDNFKRIVDSSLESK